MLSLWPLARCFSSRQVADKSRRSLPATVQQSFQKVNIQSWNVIPVKYTRPTAHAGTDAHPSSTRNPEGAGCVPSECPLLLPMPEARANSPERRPGSRFRQHVAPASFPVPQGDFDPRRGSPRGGGPANEWRPPERFELRCDVSGPAGGASVRHVIA